jgi:phosphoribosylformimino-5-aminoimidazole carboxamide ribotide isomerase
MQICLLRPTFRCHQAIIVNAASVTQIVSAFPDLPVQIGGGIRNMDIANAYIEAGVSYLIIGTMAE